MKEPSLAKLRCRYPVAMESPSRTALVFGGSGQIGIPLLARLHAAGWQVQAVSRQSQAAAPGLTWRRGDFAQPPALPAQVDVIVSCGPLDLFADWFAHSTLHCVRVVAIGSTSVHVKQTSADAAERDVARRLRDAEALLFASGNARDVSVAILRPTLVYGSGRDANLSKLAQLALRHGRLLLPRTACGLRQPVHVDDVALAAMAAASATATGSAAYDVPGGETLPYRDMVQRVLACLSPSPRLHLLPAPLFGMILTIAHWRGIARELTPAVLQRMQNDLVFDAQPARRDLNYAPRLFLPAADMFVVRD